MKLHCKYDSLVPIDTLHPFPRNRNTHTPAQITRLAKLIDFYGVRAPVVVAGEPFNCIAKGHGTVMAFRELGFKDVPVVYQSFENEDELYGYVQSDNAIAEWSQLDLAGIHLDLPDLGLPDVDLLGIKDFNFEPAEIDMPLLPDGDKSEFKQITFTLHNEQVEQVEQAMALASDMGPYDSKNENSNGNAIARVCEMFTTTNYGQS